MKGEDELYQAVYSAGVYGTEHVDVASPANACLDGWFDLYKLRESLKDLPALACANGDKCRSWFTCGRKHSFPAVDHSQKDCELPYLECIYQHFRHVCAHDFSSGPVIESDSFSTTSCKCGMTALNHSLHSMP